MEPNIKVNQLTEEEAIRRSAFTQSIINRCDARIEDAEQHSLYTALRVMLYTFLSMVGIFAVWYIIDQRYNIMMNLSDATSSYYDLYDSSMWIGGLVGIIICATIMCIGKVMSYIKNA